MALFSTQKLQLAQAREEQRAVAKTHTVMIVDDEAPNLRVLSRILSAKYHVVEATHGRDALEKIREGDYPGEISLVISDQRMPHMTGSELFKRLSGELPRAKRIILTGYADMDVILETINEARIYQFILKPFEQNDLMLTVSRALEAYDLERNVEEYQRDLERKVSERTRELLSREKLASLGRLTAGLAHELRNPLNFVKPMAEMLPNSCRDLAEKLGALGVQDAEAGDLLDEIADGLEIIRKNASRAERVVESMVRLTSDQGGRRIALNLNRLLEEHAEHALHTIQAEDETFSVNTMFDLAPACGPMEGVEQNIRRLFLNVLQNAMEAMHEKWCRDPGYAPELGISTMLANEVRTIRIRDNGPGIPESVRDSVLEPFVTTRAPDSHNVGLGLFFAYEIVKDHGGTLEIESVCGEYTEVIIRFSR